MHNMDVTEVIKVELTNLDENNEMDISDNSDSRTDFFHINLSAEKIPQATNPLTIYNPSTFQNVLQNNIIYPYDPNENLKSFLSRDNEGLIILNSFHFHFKLLPDMKNLLAKKVISREVDIVMKQENFKIGGQLSKFEITTSRFVQLANEIYEAFGDNTNIYYIPYYNVKSGGNNQRGKLWERYNTVKKKLREAGILMTNKVSHKSDSSSTIIKPEAPITINADAVAYLDWLKENIHPWQQVVTYWKHTYEARKKELHNQSDKFIYFQYPCLKERKGIDLIRADFDRLYPDKSLSLYNNWNKMKSFVKSYAMDKVKGKNKTEKNNIINKLLEDLSVTEGDHYDAAVIKILINSMKLTGLKPSVVKTLVKKRKLDDTEPVKEEKFVKPSFTLLEVQESFILHVDNAANVNAEIERKTNEAAEKQMRLQPFILTVGPKNDILKTYIVIDDWKFECTSVLEALDLTFKIFFVSDCQYPPLSHHVWLFLQVAAYEISCPGDKLGTNLNIMLHSFVSHNCTF